MFILNDFLNIDCESPYDITLKKNYFKFKIYATNEDFKKYLCELLNNIIA